MTTWVAEDKVPTLLDVLEKLGRCTAERDEAAIEAMRAKCEAIARKRIGGPFEDSPYDVGWNSCAEHIADAIARKEEGK